MILPHEYLSKFAHKLLKKKNPPWTQDNQQLETVVFFLKITKNNEQMARDFPPSKNNLVKLTNYFPNAARKMKTWVQCFHIPKLKFP
jgi:hypothetical protein